MSGNGADMAGLAVTPVAARHPGGGVAQAALCEPGEAAGRPAGDAREQAGSSQGRPCRTHSIRINQQWRVCFRWEVPTPWTLRLWIIIDGEISHDEQDQRKTFCRIPIRGKSAGGLPEAYGTQPVRLGPRGGAAAAPDQRGGAEQARGDGETDLLLARYFGISEGIFLGLQTDYDLEEARRSMGDKLESVRPRARLERQLPLPSGAAASSLRMSVEVVIASDETRKCQRRKPRWRA